VDQTAPEQRALGLHTVKVLVPGLLPLDFGWTRQRARHLPRTFTALREAGLRPGDLTEADLNPGPQPYPRPASRPPRNSRTGHPSRPPYPPQPHVSPHI